MLGTPTMSGLSDECEQEEAALIKTSALLIGPSGHFEFSSRIVALAYLLTYHSETCTTAHISNNFEEFLIAAIQRFRPDVLANSKSRSSENNKLLERQWQMEFYRASTTLLPVNKHWISPDVGALFGAEGYVDFYINDVFQWAVELLREGLDMKEHAARFTEDGAYAPMFPYVKQWAIIDFRTDKKKVRAKYPNMWHVQYNEDMTSFRVRKPGKPDWSDFIPFVGTKEAFWC